MMVELYDDIDIPDDDASMYQDPECAEWHYETAAAQDRLDEQAEDYRLELAEYRGIAEATRNCDAS